MADPCKTCNGSGVSVTADRKNPTLVKLPNGTTVPLVFSHRNPIRIALCTDCDAVLRTVEAWTGRYQDIGEIGADDGVAVPIVNGPPTAK